MTLEELYEEFDFLGDWDARGDFLIDLGFELPKLPDEAKTDENKIKRCQNNVWMTLALNTSASAPSIEISAQSDSYFVNGLIVVLLAMFQGKTPEEILNVDVKQVLSKLGLDRQVLASRKNGLFEMVTRIREFAAHAQTALDAAES
ncbi:MAG: SufE family protein [Planctomycetaceae bacterium]|nr:SufE family protein [Planctomycetaceae bacterium]